MSNDEVQKKMHDQFMENHVKRMKELQMAIDEIQSKKEENIKETKDKFDEIDRLLEELSGS